MTCLLRSIIVALSLANTVGLSFGAEATSEEVRSNLARRFEAINADWRTGETKKFESPTEEVLAEQRSALGPDDTDTLNTETLLAQIKRDLGQLNAALVLADHALVGLRSVNGETHDKTGLARMVRATVLYELARWREAAAEFRRHRAEGADR
ncbi:MAG: tetratricopeptide repeat protein, partial [Burkholderiaceae bacterium]